MKINFFKHLTKEVPYNKGLDFLKNLNWVIGESASQKVKRLDGKWKELYVQNKQLSHYSPLSLLGQNTPLSNADEKNKVLTNADLLVEIGNFARKGNEGLYNLGIEGSDYFIDSEIQKRWPLIAQDFETARLRLFNLLPWLKSTEESVVDYIVPIGLPSHINKVGFSTVNALGFVFCSFPMDNHFNFVDFAIDYSHEIGHQVLFRYQLSGELFKNGYMKNVYSPIKGVDRPAIMTFHAAIAITYMKISLIYLMRSNGLSTNEAFYCEESLKTYSDMLTTTINELLNNEIEFTSLGNTLINEILTVSKLI